MKNMKKGNPTPTNAIKEMKKAGVPSAQQKSVIRFITQEIPNTPFFHPDGKPKKKWKVFYGDSWKEAWDAARNATRDATWDAARNIALDAAWNAAWNAARYAARNAALDAALDAARYAARNATLDAARDAALFAAYFLITDLPFKNKEKNTTHVHSRWEVWKKGYGLLYDMDDVLYVYATRPTATKGVNL